MADIQPVVHDLIFGDRNMLGKQCEDQLVHPIVVVWDVREDPGLHDIDAGQRMRHNVGLFLDAGDAVALEENIAKRIRHHQLLDRDGEQGVLLVGKLADSPKIDVGENVAIHHNEGLRQVLHEQFEWASGAETLLFAADGEFDPIAGAISKEVLNVVGFIIGRKENFSDPVVAKMLDLNLQHRLLADG